MRLSIHRWWAIFQWDCFFGAWAGWEPVICSVPGVWQCVPWLFIQQLSQSNLSIGSRQCWHFLVPQSICLPVAHNQLPQQISRPSVPSIYRFLGGREGDFYLFSSKRESLCATWYLAGVWGLNCQHWRFQAFMQKNIEKIIFFLSFSLQANAGCSSFIVHNLRWLRTVSLLLKAYATNIGLKSTSG